MTDYDLEIMAKTIFGEARGETEQGQIAVACCILNRFKAKKWYSGRTVAATCLKPWQFSCWNKSDPNAQKLATLTFPAYSKYFPIIEKAKQKDIVNGATHYYAPAVCSMPAWAKGKKPCAKIGGHLFFKGID
ncbi:MAG TPA: cell wall hydrolase [Alphaproteobacteria bacterium]|nr:cell wall hydrolase [Alphaproteobacteria bacterium]